jgi:ankyrin repeat protein
LIFYSLSNTDPETRYNISSFILDKGVDVTVVNSNGATVLHILLNQVKHNSTETIELCRRLIDCGADVGVLDKRGISIMQHVVNIGIHERDLEPLYDILFKEPNLDFTSKNFRGFSAMDLAIKSGLRPKLIERMKAYGQREDS